MKKRILLAIVLGIIGFILVSCSKNTKVEEVKNTESNRDELEEAIKKDIDNVPGIWVIEDDMMDDDYNVMYHFKNTSKFHIGLARANVRGYDKDGNIVYEADTSISNVKPNREILVNDNIYDIKKDKLNEVEKRELELSYASEMTDEDIEVAKALNKNFKIEDVDKDSPSFIKLKYKLKNTTGIDLSELSFYIDAYDEEGNIVYSEYASIKNSLSNGETITGTDTISSEGLKRNYGERTIDPEDAVSFKFRLWNFEGDRKTVVSGESDIDTYGGVDRKELLEELNIIKGEFQRMTSKTGYLDPFQFESFREMINDLAIKMGGDLKIRFNDTSDIKKRMETMERLLNEDE